MWFLLGWLLGRSRRWPTVEERKWRRRRGHPWAFVFVCAMIAGAVSDDEMPADPWESDNPTSDALEVGRQLFEGCPGSGPGPSPSRLRAR